MAPHPFDSGNLAFQMAASALVLLLAPGLAFFYAGLVGRKQPLAVLVQCFAAMGWTGFLWWACGFSMVFSGGQGGVVGNFQHAFLNGIRPDTLIIPSSGQPVPALALFVYHMALATLAPALLAAVCAGRIRFSAFLAFLSLWLVFVQFPFEHMAWGRGLFAQWGLLDYAGGAVLHAAAGFAGLAAVLHAGRRRYLQQGPHNLPLAALGTGLLWFGWHGLAAGAALRLDGPVLLALANTDLCAATAAVTWLGLAWTLEKQPRFAGVQHGALAGLVAASAAAGHISPQGAAALGALAGAACYLANGLRDRLGLDDALAVWACHGMGGAVGCLGAGLFASTLWNPAGAEGLAGSGPGQLGIQAAVLALVLAYAFLFSWVALWLLGRVLPARPAGQEPASLGLGLEGEQAGL
jgi:Amt family ammonium transporter